MFKCPALSEVRARRKDLLTWLPKSNEATQQLALFPDYNDALRIKVAFELPWELGSFRPTAGTSYLFLDGSARFQRSMEHCLAVSAVVESEFMVNKTRTVHSQLLPGLRHNSCRAGVFAVLLALCHTATPHLFSDCQSVVDTFGTFLQAWYFDTDPRCPEDSDLWSQIWQQLLSRPKHEVVAISITKVPAHVSPDVWPLSFPL